MKEERLYFGIILTGLIALLIIMSLLAFTSRESDFTELSFENPTELPSSIELGKEYNFQFSIKNMEGEEINYDYKVSILFESNKEEILKIGNINMAEDTNAMISSTFSISEEFDTAKAVIEVNDQEIYFFIEPSK